MRRPQDLHGSLALGALAVAVALFATWLRLGLPLPACEFKQWTGLPCATCGTTRLVRALAAGEFLAALSLNPLVFGGIALTVSWGVLSATRLVFGLPERRLVLGSRARSRLVVGAAIAVIANWVYLLWRGI